MVVLGAACAKTRIKCEVMGKTKKFITHWFLQVWLEHELQQFHWISQLQVVHLWLVQPLLYVVQQSSSLLVSVLSSDHLVLEHGYPSSSLR